MVNIPLILRARRRRSRVGSFGQRHRQAGKLASLLLGLLLLGGLLVLIILYNNLWADLPSLEQLPLRLEPRDGKLLPPTTLYDRTGTQVIAVLADPAALDRQYLSLEGNPATSLPQVLVDATLAAADPDFWEHSGVHPGDWDPESHPTLAQQLVFEQLLADEPSSLRRSLREHLLAGQATLRFGREQILAWYLNHSRYGELVHGADAAARVYFGKPANQLTLAEAASLAAISQTPEVNPYQAPQVILEKRNQILQTMLEKAWITASQQQQASRQSLVLVDRVEAAQVAPAFVELVLQQLEAHLPRRQVELGGFQIITTLDWSLQTQVTCAGSTLIERYSPTDSPEGGSEGLDTTCPAARLLPTLPQPASAPIPGLQASVIVLDPQTGQILSLGGNSAPDSPASAPHRPVGTLALPFLYLNAFSRGFSPGTLAWDIPTPGSDSGLMQAAYQGPVRLRTALVNDYLTPARQLINQLGMDTTLTTAWQLGALAQKNNASAGGLQPAGDVLNQYLAEPASLLSLAHAYATLDHQGVAAGQEMPAGDGEGAAVLQPYAVLRVEDGQHQVLLDWTKPVERAVISAQLAHLLNHSLSDEVSRWSSLGHPNSVEIGRPAAAKAGQTLDQRDAWAIGYTPQRLVGVWLGIADPETEATLSTQAAAALWHAVIQTAVRSLPAEGWSAPPGISEIQVCDPSGMLPTPSCPLTVTEVYLYGTEPNQGDTLYQEFQINRETGKLATVFTRPELVNEEVFMIVPAEARTWAAQAGLPMPPEDYDVLSVLPSENPTVNLQAPAMFSYVRGQVKLTGSAEGAGFQFYRLYYGKGLNPQQWLQIGADASTPVKTGVLGTWDTQGLSGLYALQLQVVRLEQRVETALIQVTVDNTPPEIALLSPLAGTVHDAATEPNLVIHAKVSDDLEMGEVVFLMDGKPLATFAAAPYLLAWAAQPGEHILTISATDLAGNQTSSEITFAVK